MPSRVGEARKIDFSSEYANRQSFILGYESWGWFEAFRGENAVRFDVCAVLKTSATTTTMTKIEVPTVEADDRSDSDRNAC